MSLTDRAIINLKPTGKSSKHFDGGGLHIFLSPTGGKLWRLVYRFEGKEKLLSFGQYPAVGLKMARERRDEAKEMLAKGIDPGARNAREKSSRRYVSLQVVDRPGRSFGFPHDRRLARTTQKPVPTAVPTLPTRSKR